MNAVSLGSAVSAQDLAARLIESGKLKQSDADRAQVLANEERRGLGRLLTRLGLVSDRDVALAYAQILACPLFDEAAVPAGPPITPNCKESFLRDAKLLPLGSEANGLRVVTADPENAFALDALAMAAGTPLSLLIATVAQIDAAHDCWFGSEATAETVAANAAEDLYSDTADAIDRLRDMASEAPVIRLVNTVIQEAVQARASDIHVEHVGGSIRVRYRIDGVLLTQDTVPNQLAPAFLSRIKLIAGMNIAERRLPQDGRVQVRIQGAVVDLRVSTIPTVGAESIVLRILDQEQIRLTLSTLGFDPGTADAVNEAIRHPNGIVLVTGPTGSGKTTTLYAILQQLNSSERKILTIEDPVEYQLEGINQIQVKPQIGLDFPRALRAIVRQDPDVVMVGEMRDLETARIAVQSALTGHLVFSTLHTNDAGSSVTRLLDMGVENYLVTSSVVAIVAQRLVRKLCERCREPQDITHALETARTLGDMPEGPHVTLYRAVGCEDCRHTGYLGRTVIAEALLIDDSVRAAILTKTDGRQIQALAVDRGMQSMRVDGLRKAAAGITTAEEIARVACV